GSGGSCCPREGGGAAGGDGAGFDPILLGARATTHTLEDVNVAGTVSRLRVVRGYTSSTKDWGYSAILGRLRESFLPQPFAASPGYAESIRWTHSLYSLVYARGWSPGTSVWAVREPTGASRTFIACSSGSAACTASQAGTNTQTGARLFFSGGGVSSGY